MDTNLREKFERIIENCDGRTYFQVNQYYFDLMQAAYRLAKSENEASVVDLQAQVKAANDAFVWLLGYTDFPERKDGEGAYYWRSKLRAKLKELGFEFDLPQPPQQ